jgi:prepilin-type N-terminal cleavage/methylation domain-containing protein
MSFKLTAAVSPAAGQAMSAPQSLRIRPAAAGFTLVEMLVVIGILGVLAAITAPALLGLRRSARTRAIKSEIDMLHIAFENYAEKYRDLPPCRSTPNDNAEWTDPAGWHLRSIFPRIITWPDARYPRDPTEMLGYMNTPADVPFQSLGRSPPSMAITERNAIVIWLSGYTTDLRRPVLSTTGSVAVTAGVVSGVWLDSGTLTPTGTLLPRLRLYEFDDTRIRITTGTDSLQYWAPGQPASTYCYIDADRYPTVFYTGTTAAQLEVVAAHRVPRVPLPAKPSATTPDAWYFTTAGSGTNDFFNPDSFQILCAGADGAFGTDDDLSNFWNGTRRQYLDGLRTQ